MSGGRSSTVEPAQTDKQKAHEAPKKKVFVNPIVPPELDPFADAVIAWSVCASIHRVYCKGRDPFYKTRQADFVRHEAEARERLKARDAGHEKKSNISIEQVKAACLTLRNSGKKIEAIKCLRNHRKYGLKDAMDQIEAWAAEVGK